MQERLGQQGCYSFVHDFPAVNNASTTYTVSVSFNGTNPASASATSITLGGSNYAMCTTIQYGNQPCGNSTVLTVDPQSTIATTPTKTPEEMRQDAKDGGCLSIHNEFSLFYPWFKTVGEVTLNLLSGMVVFRSELAPLTFSQTTTVASGADSLIQELRTAFRKVGVEAVVAYCVAILSAKFAAWMFSKSSLIGLAVAIGIYAVVTLATTGVLNWAYGKEGLLVSAIAFFMSLSIDLLVGWINGDTHFLRAFVSGICEGAGTGKLTSMWHSWWGSSMNFYNIVSAAAFYIVDLGLGAGLAYSL